MKRIAMAAILLGALGVLIPARQASAQVSVSVSIGGFYDELSPHGEWIDCSYGECWVPRGVAAGWQPYTNGEWIYTRYGWTWVSNDPWGNDPYHYGTWAFVGRYGWVWVPGTVWAPAWVTWCYSDRYVGWAPMPPTVTFGSSGYSGRAVVVAESQYVFVPTNHFVGTNVTSVRMEPGRNAELFHQAKPATRFGVSGGIVTNVALPMATVQRATGTKIQTREISAARTAPRTFSAGSAGKTGHVPIVAPAAEVKAAHASRQGTATHAAAPEAQHQQQAKPQAQAQQQHAKQQEQATQQKAQKQQEQSQQQQHAKQQEQATQQKAQKQQEQVQQQQHAKQQEQATQQKAQKQQEQVQQQQHAKQQEQATQQKAQKQQEQSQQQQHAKQQEQSQQQHAKQQEQAKPQPQQQQPQQSHQQANPPQQQNAPPQQKPENAKPGEGEKKN